MSTVWPRCRSGAVGSNPTLTISGRPVFRGALELRRAARSRARRRRSPWSDAQAVRRWSFLDYVRNAGLRVSPRSRLRAAARSAEREGGTRGAPYRGRANIAAMASAPAAAERPAVAAPRVLQGLRRGRDRRRRGDGGARVHVRAPPHRGDRAHAATSRDGRRRWPASASGFSPTCIAARRSRTR